MTNGQRGTVHSSSKDSAPDIARDTPLERRKAEARALATVRRAETARQAGPGTGAALCERVLGAIAFPTGCAVSAYWPMASEIDVHPLIAALHDRGHAIGLPVTLRRGLPLVFRTWAPGIALLPGGFGTRIPGPDRPEVGPRVLVVPLLAFDRAGYRLGYGGGFYDRTLAALRALGPACAVGVAYGAQEVPQVPNESHDQRLDWIVTESEAIEIGQGEPARNRTA